MKKKWNDLATLEDAISMGLKPKEFDDVKKSLNRELNLVEVGIVSALYSEHCSYKSSKIHLKKLPTKGQQVILGPGENAGVVDIGDDQAVAFKIESHNHPSYIEPYQGAATGVGGILRDVFTMGARPIALLNSLRFGDLSHSKTKYLTKRAVAGIGGYGNCMGVPTIGGELFFHSAYNGNCLVNAFALGILDKNKIFLGQASGIGNKVFYIGSKTGCDGIHGATMASAEFNEDSEEKRPTVQVGDPFQEKLLLEACLEVMETGAVVGIQDMGAAGMTSSSFEMAHRAGTGVEIHLDRVPQREEGMTPYEIMLSESQERMLFIIKDGSESEVIKICHKWVLDAVEIGEVVSGKDVTLYWHGEIASRMPVAAVTENVPLYEHKYQEPKEYLRHQEFNFSALRKPEKLGDVWLKILSSVNISSRAPIYNQYDSTVRTNTVIHPGSDAGVIRIKREDTHPNEKCDTTCEKGIAISLDCNSRYCKINPYWGAAHALAEGIRNITASGAKVIGVSNCLNFGNPEKPESMWEIVQAIEGLGEAATRFRAPIVSGNVSLYNETDGKGILPTPEIATVGLIKDASKAVQSNFLKEGDAIFVIGETKQYDFGGSEFLSFFHKLETGMLPELDFDLEIRTNSLISSLIEGRLLNSCHDISSGGLSVALAESCFSDKVQYGAFLEPLHPTNITKESILFSETKARYIISSSSQNEAKVLKLVEEAGLVTSFKGKVGGDVVEIKDVAKIPLREAYLGWKETLEKNIFS